MLTVSLTFGILCAVLMAESSKGVGRIFSTSFFGILAFLFLLAGVMT